MSAKMYGLLQGQIPNLVSEQINLSDLGLAVRNFPQVQQLRIVRPDQQLADRLQSLHARWPL